MKCSFGKGCNSFSKQDFGSKFKSNFDKPDAGSVLSKFKSSFGTPDAGSARSKFKSSFGTPDAASALQRFAKCGFSAANNALKGMQLGNNEMPNIQQGGSRSVSSESSSA
jgi:hypothetical protein